MRVRRRPRVQLRLLSTVADLPVPDPAPLLARGLAVLALPPGGRQAPPGWHDRVITGPGQLAASWRPGDNIGVACRASRVVGLDLDRHPGDVDGMATFTALCSHRRRPWPATLTVRTPHGLHLYYRAPAGPAVIPSSAARWPGIDIRGPGRHRGGYLIGPGSVVGGRAYVIEHDIPIAELPAWLAAALARRNPVPSHPCINPMLMASPADPASRRSALPSRRPHAECEALEQGLI